MKMDRAIFDRLQDDILTADIALEDFAQRYWSAGFSHERYRWDVLHLALTSAGVCELYRPTFGTDGLKDDHIDTALRKILGGQYQQDTA